MNTDLVEIIAALQEEKERLQAQLNAALAEADYELAHWLQRGFSRLEQKLEVLQVFLNKDYREFQFKKRMLTGMQERLSGQALAGPMVAYVEQIQAETRAEMEGLALSGPRSTCDSQELDDAFFALVEKRVPGFRLVVVDDESWHLHFTLEEEHGLIRGRFTGEVKAEHLRVPFAAACAAIGFKTREGGRPELEYPLKDFKDAWELKMILSRLVYDVLEPYCRQQKGLILYD